MQGNKAGSNYSTSQEFGGGNLAIIASNVSFNNTVVIHNSSIVNGYAFWGAGMFIHFYRSSRACENHLIVSNSNITHNTAHEDGGAAYFMFCQGFRGHCDKPTTFNFSNCIFSYNKVQTPKDAGAGISINNTILHMLPSSNYAYHSIFLDRSVFKYNFNTGYGEALSSGSAVFYASLQVGELLIKDCNFTHNNVTALAAFRSEMSFKGNVLIDHNVGYEGGGIILCEASYMMLKPDTNLTISYNHANFTGGGIFAEGRCVQIAPLCFYQIYTDDLSNINEILTTIHVNLVHNTSNFCPGYIFFFV